MHLLSIVHIIKRRVVHDAMEDSHEGSVSHINKPLGIFSLIHLLFKSSLYISMNLNFFKFIELKYRDNDKIYLFIL